MCKTISNVCLCFYGFKYFPYKFSHSLSFYHIFTIDGSCGKGERRKHHKYVLTRQTRHKGALQFYVLLEDVPFFLTTSVHWPFSVKIEILPEVWSQGEIGNREHNKISLGILAVSESLKKRSYKVGGEN